MAQAPQLYKQYFLEYASYVIRDRAIPDLVDGLKPVQRRILHSLFEMDDGKFHKVANVVGWAMRYHPHGAVQRQAESVDMAGFLDVFKYFLLQFQIIRFVPFAVGDGTGYQGRYDFITRFDQCVDLPAERIRSAMGKQIFVPQHPDILFPRHNRIERVGFMYAVNETCFWLVGVALLVASLVPFANAKVAQRSTRRTAINEFFFIQLSLLIHSLIELLNDF